MKTLAELKTAVLEDGTIDDAEVTEIEAVVYEDGIIDQEEADLMFELNDAVTGKEGNSVNWPPLFAKVLTDFVTADEETPGVVDEEEAKYIVSKVEGDGQVDSTEKMLLASIKEKATIIHPTLGSFMEAQGI